IRNPYVFTVADGNNAGRTRIGNNGRERNGDNYQAGNEHATLAQLGDGTGIVMFRTASKETLNGEAVYRRVQLGCASLTLTPQGAQLNVDKYVTRNRGNQYRQAHAPVAMAIDGGKAAAVFYNNRPNNPNNTQRYVQVFDAQCNSLSEQTLVMAKNNDDVCANAENGASVSVESRDGYERIVSGCGGNGNGRDDGWVYEVTIQRQGNGQYAVNKTWDLSVEPQEERTRMTLVNGPAGSNMVAACWSAGNTQPTNRGVRCGGIDTNVNGEQGANAQNRLLWRQYVARREGRIYQTQIKLTPDAAAPGQATATWQTLIKRRRRGKGQASLNLARLSFSRDGMQMVTAPIQGSFPGGDATHRSMIATQWGKDGAAENAIMLISSSVNGSPDAISVGQLLTWDGTQNTYMRRRQVSVGAAIDNAWISNIYGNNPTTQGRNHIQGLEIQNPYYGQAEGFQSNVKSFVAIAATPRLTDETKPNGREDKLALQLVLIPAVVAPDAKDPGAQDPVALDPSGDGTGTGTGT
ncbi:MAG: hypothetical protein MJE77_19410, partial [Proteobacteria bacterium]|nr:hypothetical protein [Pseudomonadota bacterium]